VHDWGVRTSGRTMVDIARTCPTNEATMPAAEMLSGRSDSRGDEVTVATYTERRAPPTPWNGAGDLEERRAMRRDGIRLSLDPERKLSSIAIGRGGILDRGCYDLSLRGAPCEFMAIAKGECLADGPAGRSVKPSDAAGARLLVGIDFEYLMPSLSCAHQPAACSNRRAVSSSAADHLWCPLSVPGEFGIRYNVRDLDSPINIRTSESRSGFEPALARRRRRALRDGARGHG